MPAPNIEGVDSWSRSEFAPKARLDGKAAPASVRRRRPKPASLLGNADSRADYPKTPAASWESAVRAAADGASALSDASAALSQALRLRDARQTVGRGQSGLGRGERHPERRSRAPEPAAIPIGKSGARI